MGFVISHIWVLIGCAAFVAVAAVGWWYLMDLNARLKRQRAEARRQEMLERQKSGDS
ncbi:MAG: hypothetical protein IJH75_08155 [Mogibacterium sp.]|nr:hypothetical protein [Mogibacterium sp.]